ncbi:MAG: hypothetical protein ACE5FT_01690 [Candidatus Nanoarchaeia archaeon]
MKNTGELMVLGIVLIVALAGAYASGATGGTILVISGETGESFGRPLGNRMAQVGGGTHYQCYVNAEGENVCCYEQNGGWHCEDGSGATFGVDPDFREGKLASGRGKMVFESPTKPGIVLG